MNYSDLKTYTRTQAKYIRKIFQIRTVQDEYKGKICELTELKQIYKNEFDEDDFKNIEEDIQKLNNDINNAEKFINKWIEMIEHIEILCNTYGGSGETEYLKHKPEGANEWKKMTVKDFENRYGCNLENLGETDESERESTTSTKRKQKKKGRQ